MVTRQDIVDFMQTTPSHPAFSQATNQAPHCWQRYNEYIMCLRSTEGDEDKCLAAKQLAYSICPDDWTAKWDEERPLGTFPGIQWPIVNRKYLHHKFPNGEPGAKDPEE